MFEIITKISKDIFCPKRHGNHCKNCQKHIYGDTLGFLTKSCTPDETEFCFVEQNNEVREPCNSDRIPYCIVHRQKNRSDDNHMKKRKKTSDIGSTILWYGHLTLHMIAFTFFFLKKSDQAY